MSSDSEAKEGAAEPSMEDILASIRRILSDDASNADADNEGGAPADGSAPSPAPPSEWGATAQPVARPVGEEDGAFGAGNGASSAAGIRRVGGDVFMLTPEMRIAVPESAAIEPKVMSSRTAASGSDVLSQLASAILDRRDIAIGARDVTLESMVREMLRPLLREWLDRNLPYLIERLVKREIDIMVNRAERLED